MCDNARECAAAERQGFHGPGDGPAAAREPAAEVHPARTLVDKLGIRQGMRVIVAGGLDPAVEAQIRDAGVHVITFGEEPARGAGTAPGDAQAAFLQVADREGLAALRPLRDAIARDGMLWVLWPKGRTGFGQGDVQRAGLDAGLVDVKVASVTETLSGLKFVYRRRDR